MKKLLSIILPFIIMISLGACSNVENKTATTDTVSTQTLTEQATKEPTNKPTEKPTETPTEKLTSPPTEPPIETPMWKQAYIDKVNALYYESDGFFDEFNLVYINDDNIPELYAMSGVLMNPDQLCWYNNGKVDCIQIGYYGLVYIPKSGCFLSQSMLQYTLGESVYYFDGATCEQLFSGVTYTNGDYTYRVNDEDVSESTYLNMRDNCYDYSRSIKATDTIYTRSEIINVINNW